MKRTKLWIKSIWLYIWFTPFVKVSLQKEYYEFYDSEKDEDVKELLGEFEEIKWYVKPRVLSWFIIFPIVVIPLFIYGGFKMIIDYFKYIFSYYEIYITTLPRKVSFITKLDIVKALS